MKHLVMFVIVALSATPPPFMDQHPGGTAPNAAAPNEFAVELACTGVKSIVCYEPLTLSLRITNTSGRDIILKEPVLSTDSGIRATAAVSVEGSEPARVYKFPVLDVDSVNDMESGSLGKLRWANGSVIDVGLVFGYDWARRAPVFEQAGKYHVKFDVEMHEAHFATNEVVIAVMPLADAEAAAVAILKRINPIPLYCSKYMSLVDLSNLALIAEDRTSVVLAAYARLALARWERGSAIEELPLVERRQHLTRAKELLEGLRCSSADLQLSKQYDATAKSVHEALQQLESSAR
jgi:hypothetical protein